MSLQTTRKPRRMNNRVKVLARLAVAALAAITVRNACVVSAQSSATEDWEKSAGGKMSFEIASIKQINSSDGPPVHFTRTGGLFSAAGYKLAFYIGFAYKLSPYEGGAVFSQLPDWAKTAQYDVEARAAGNPSTDQYRLMMQSLLAERFKLRVHRETSQAPVYDLVLVKSGKLGPNLRRYADDPPCPSTQVLSTAPIVQGIGELPPNCDVLVPMKSSGSGLLKAGARNLSMPMIADYLLTLFNLSPYKGLDRPVLDHTQLTGTFDFTIEWLQQNAAPIAAPLAESSGPTIQQSLQNQLGLKLVSATAPVEKLIIDQIEQLSPN